MRISRNQYRTLSGFRSDQRAATFAAIFCGWLVCLLIDLGAWDHARLSTDRHPIQGAIAISTPTTSPTDLGRATDKDAQGGALFLSREVRLLSGFVFILALGVGLALGGLSGGALAAAMLAYGIGGFRYILSEGADLHFDWHPTAGGIVSAILVYGVYMETLTRTRLKLVLERLLQNRGSRPWEKNERIGSGALAALTELEVAADHMCTEWLRLQRLLDSQPWGTIALDMSGRIVTCSATVESLLGCAPIYNQPLQNSLRHLPSLHEHGALALLEEGIEVQDGDRSLWLKKSRVSDDYWITATVVIMDVSPLRRALDSKMASLRFLSHDLRSPQNSIVSLADLSECAPDEFEACGGIAQISRLAKYTLFLSESFIFTSLSDNMRSNQVTKFDLAATITDVCEHQRVAANRKRVRLNLTVTEVGGVWIRGVRSFVARAIQNIVDNAVQASGNGQTVQIVLCGTPDGAAQICIKDEAGGLPGIRGTVFVSDFHSLPLTGTARGFGLGHQIVAKILEMHGGTLVATSQEYVGTTFVMRLPRGGIGTGEQTDGLVPNNGLHTEAESASS